METLKIERTGFGDIVVLQKEGLGYGVDAVLLAAFAAGETGARGVQAGARVADLGTGSGIVSFIVAHKVPDSRLTGFEVREGAADRAIRAAELNHMEERVSIVRTDITDAAMDEYTGCFDAVVSNPPYFRQNAAMASHTDDKFIARHETTALLRDFVRTAARLLKDRGSFYMVHRPDRLVDIVTEMRQAGLEPKCLQMVAPKPGREANIMLIQGIKGAGRELKLLPEIVVHTDDNGYTETINRIYER